MCQTDTFSSCCWILLYLLFWCKMFLACMASFTVYYDSHIWTSGRVKGGCRCIDRCADTVQVTKVDLSTMFVVLVSCRILIEIGNSCLGCCVVNRDNALL